MRRGRQVVVDISMATVFQRLKVFYPKVKNIEVVGRFSGKTSASSAKYCINIVRQLDYENYLCCLLVNENCRQSLFAIRAFNIEIAKISDTTVETVGEMKIHFWKQALDSIYTKNQCPEHPVVKELERAILQHNMSRIWFSKLLDGRGSYFHNRPFNTIQDLEGYSEKTASSVLYLTLEALGLKNTSADHCASHLGKAIGIVTLLRSTPYHAQSRRVLWPTDILLQHHISQENILRGENLLAIKDAAYQLASLAHVHLDKARLLRSSVPKSGIRGFLPAVACDNYLKSLQQLDFNIFHSKLQHRNTLLPILLLKHVWRKTF